MYINLDNNDEELLYFVVLKASGSEFEVLPDSHNSCNCTRRCRGELHNYDYRQGGTPIWKSQDARTKIWIKSLKKTNLDVARALFDP